jgi:hypothetical protein
MSSTSHEHAPDKYFMGDHSADKSTVKKPVVIIVAAVCIFRWP